MVFIFDMDGVVVDNHLFHLQAWIEFGKQHGINITESEFRKHFGSTNQTVLKSIFGNTISELEIDILGKEKESIYRELYTSFIKPVEGLPSFLQYAHNKRIPIALATSAPYENIQFTLNATGLQKYFSILTDSSMVSRGKPDPQVYLITAAKLGVHPSECIVFEDSIPGIQSAKNAGMQVVGVATTHKPHELMMHVNEIIMNFAAPENLIEKLNQNTKS
jgi:HAD superfamily hydrolase (TIGR01509 family)